MQSEIKAESAETELQYYLARLAAEDVPFLQPLEDLIKLSFWGNDNYRRFLEEMPEYFGGKAVLLSHSGKEHFIGFFLARSASDNLEILKLGVFPEYQKHGIGAMLMETSYAEGIRRGCNRCFLEVRKSNQVAIQFYYNQKFRIAGTRLNYYTDPVEDAWIMERSL